VPSRTRRSSPPERCRAWSSGEESGYPTTRARPPPRSGPTGTPSNRSGQSSALANCVTSVVRRRDVSLTAGLARLGFDFEDVPFKIQPERGVGDGQLAHLLALREDPQAATLVVEVLELDGL
jgi:hypothetical protein